MDAVTVEGPSRKLPDFRFLDKHVLQKDSRGVTKYQKGREILLTGELREMIIVALFYCLY